MSDETNDAPAADMEDGAAEVPADTAAADAPVTVEDLVAALEAVTAERDTTGAANTNDSCTVEIAHFELSTAIYAAGTSYGLRLARGCA